MAFTLKFFLSVPSKLSNLLKVWFLLANFGGIVMNAPVRRKREVGSSKGGKELDLLWEKGVSD